ncbi:F-box/kelch-repeat protein At5g15710 isoform X1 [Physcomitrium patens]|uniref:F-box/kelch-repeat protein At5g15710 isoform X1 n=1 Tax=Physcomitrium patens TaxID=3218 RepID=UPI00024AFC4E|nr:F-box/kelch-repeat protein At5g15710-like isoform X1 [Physcomitrium patens]|eukprot:XP_024379963.1 F-box/kelch-repeat protein At5g15710-like isoform X1 [Physcomitrella patens]
MSELCEIMSDEPCPMWNKLSSELQDRVLAFLPVLALVNLRTVCKRWATLPSSQSFKILCMLVSPQPSYLLVCRRAHTFCAAYDQSLNLWYDLNLRFLDQMCLPYLECPNGEVYHSVEAASGGLFFIWSHKSDGEPSLYSVCNPVTRTWRKLPSLPYHIVPLAVAMVTDRLTWKYKIFVAADSSPETLLSPMAMQVYDSSTRCWQRLRLMPPHLDIVWSSAICNEIMYVLSFDPCDLWSYDLNRDLWNKVDIQVPYSLSMTLLVNCGETLYLVGEVRGHTPRCISIWQFNMTARTCSEISQIPHPLFEDHASDETYRMWSAIGHRNGIAFKNGVVRTLLYDVNQRTANWLPDCRGNFEYDNGYSVYGYSTPLNFEAEV